MADSTTTVAPPAFTYTPPPDFIGRADQINNAYQSALNKTQLQRSNLYSNAGLIQGTSQLDTNNQYGAIQQMLHNEGQQLSADDAAETHRGLGLDSGLGAQNADGIRYAEHAQASNYGTTLQQNLTGLTQNDADALTTKNQDMNSNNTDQASFNSQQNAYNDALASYLKMVSNQSTPAATPIADGTQGAFERAANNGAVAKAAAKPSSKVTIANGRVIGGT